MMYTLLIINTANSPLNVTSCSFQSKDDAMLAMREAWEDCYNDAIADYFGADPVEDLSYFEEDDEGGYAVVELEAGSKTEFHVIGIEK